MKEYENKIKSIEIPVDDALTKLVLKHYFVSIGQRCVAKRKLKLGEEGFLLQLKRQGFKKGHKLNTKENREIRKKLKEDRQKESEEKGN